MKTKHIMLDLETLSTDPNACVLQVGAVHFDIDTGKLLDSCLYNLDVVQQIILVESGAIIDEATLKWWRGQSNSAKTSLVLPRPINVLDFIKKFNAFLTKGVGTEYKDYALWGNGSNFDNVIIRSLYKRFNQEFPVPFWADSDLRTALMLADKDMSDIKFEGERHISTNDCIYQIKKLVKAKG